MNENYSCREVSWSGSESLEPFKGRDESLVSPSNWSNISSNRSPLWSFQQIRDYGNLFIYYLGWVLHLSRVVWGNYLGLVLGFVAFLVSLVILRPFCGVGFHLTQQFVPRLLLHWCSKLHWPWVCQIDRGTEVYWWSSDDKDTNNGMEGGLFCSLLMALPWFWRECHLPPSGGPL